MTKTTDESGLVEVTQADRDAAASWYLAQPFPSKQIQGRAIAAGEWDHHSLAQAFAHRRISSTWCAVCCLTEDEQEELETDERFVFTEHESEEAAVAALTRTTA